MYKHEFPGTKSYNAKVILVRSSGKFLLENEDNVVI